tara:strand:+ start:225 stop:875 length:651 start_codon:yes stop_codon:yes gene_type:complete
MKKFLSFITFLFCTLIFAQTQYVKISKSLNFEFNENNVILNEHPDYNISLSEYPTNNLNISALDYSVDDDTQTFLFISAALIESTSLSKMIIEGYSFMKPNVDLEGFNGSIILDVNAIIELIDQIEIIYSNRKAKNFSSSYNLDFFYDFHYELTNGIVYMYIPTSIFYEEKPELFNQVFQLFNNDLRKYNSIEGISFKLNAEEIKQFRKFLNHLKS